MKGDYKFWYIKRDDSGKITEAAIRYYEGDITTENEYNPITDQLVPITRYRRTKKLKKADLPVFADRKSVLKSNGEEAFIYTPTDFGDITDNDELRAYLNKEMKKDTTRDNIVEQTEEDVEKLRAVKIK